MYLPTFPLFFLQNRHARFILEPPKSFLLRPKFILERS